MKGIYMKHMRKLIAFFGILFTTLAIVSSQFTVAEPVITTALGAEYLVETRIADETLSSGVRYIKDRAQSSASLRITTQTEAGLGSVNPLIAGQLYPQQVNVLEVPTAENVKVIPWTVLTQSGWTLSTVRNIARNFETLNPGWRVIAAVNGDFFDIRGGGNLPYQPSGAHMSDGEMFRSLTSGKTVGFMTNNGSNSIIGGTPTRTSQIMMSIYDEFDHIIETIPVNRINQEPLTGEFSLYYANWKQKTDEDSQQELIPIQVNVADSTQFIVSNADRALANRTTDFYGIGTISHLTEDVTLMAGQFALVSKSEAINQKLALGVKVRLQYEYTGDFSNAHSVIGAGATILFDGEAIDNIGDAPRHPRTMIGRKADGTIVLATIDGRQAQRDMYGATHQEMAALLLHYGAVEAYNLDGGGSTTMIIRRGNDYEVVNSPSDGGERKDTNGLLVVAYDPSLAINHMNDSTIEIEQRAFGVKDVTFSNASITINGQTKQIENGMVSFDGLTSLTTYEATFTYELTTGSNTELVIGDPFTFTTGRKRPNVVTSTIVGESDNKYVIDYGVVDEDNSIISLILKYDNKEIFLNGLSGRIDVNKSTPSQVINFELEVLYNHQGVNTTLEDYRTPIVKSLIIPNTPTITKFDLLSFTSNTVTFDYEITDIDDTITEIILFRGNSEIGLNQKVGTREVTNIQKGVVYQFYILIRYKNPITNELLGQVTSSTISYENQKVTPIIQDFSLSNGTENSITINYEITDPDTAVLGILLKQGDNEIGLDGLSGLHVVANLLPNTTYSFHIVVLYKTIINQETIQTVTSDTLTYDILIIDEPVNSTWTVVAIAGGSTIGASGLAAGIYFLIKRRKI
jgi:exopolysaccharide biosynthesis protein